jgi:hypothetical protein
MQAQVQFSEAREMIERERSSWQRERERFEIHIAALERKKDELEQKSQTLDQKVVWPKSPSHCYDTQAPSDLHVGAMAPRLFRPTYSPAQRHSPIYLPVYGPAIGLACAKARRSAMPN